MVGAWEGLSFCIWGRSEEVKFFLVKEWLMG